jgi:hypothetical protein
MENTSPGFFERGSTLVRSVFLAALTRDEIAPCQMHFFVPFARLWLNLQNHIAHRVERNKGEGRWDVWTEKSP